MGRRFYVALLPWMMFAFVARHGGQGLAWAALAALAGCLVVASSERRDGGAASPFLRASIVLALVLLALGLLGGATFDLWARCLGAGGLTVLAAASIGGAPFVEHYARDLVPPAAVDTAAFRAATRAVASTWVVVLATLATSFLVAAIVWDPVVATIFNWIVPSLALLWGTERIARRWDLDFGEEPGGVYGLFEV